MDSGILNNTTLGNDLQIRNEKYNIIQTMMRDKGIIPAPHTQKLLDEYKFKSQTQIKWQMGNTIEIRTEVGGYLSTLWIKQDGSCHGLEGYCCLE